jgi:hypothetical protein
LTTYGVIEWRRYKNKKFKYVLKQPFKSPSNEKNAKNSKRSLSKDIIRYASVSDVIIKISVVRLTELDDHELWGNFGLHNELSTKPPLNNNSNGNVKALFCLRLTYGTERLVML